LGGTEGGSVSCFALLDPFSAIKRALRPVFLFYAPGLVLGSTEGAVQFSCFTLQHPFSAIPRTSNLVFMFCASELIFGGTKGVRYNFHILSYRNYFARYRGSRVQFSCFTLLDPFSAIKRVSGPVFMFQVP
jgi:hypothetical protein